MPTKGETRLHGRIKKAVLKTYPGSWIVKIHGGPMQPAGIPDLVGVISGRFVGLEVKLPDGDHELTKLQESQLRAIRAAGGIGAVVTSPEEALEALADELLA